MQDIRKNVLPQFIELCMDTPCLCPGVDKLRASEPASQRVMRVIIIEPWEIYVGCQSIFLSSAFGGFWLLGTSFRYPRSPFNILLLSAFIFFIFCEGKFCFVLLSLNFEIWCSIYECIRKRLKIHAYIYILLQIHGKWTSAKPPGGQ